MAVISSVTSMALRPDATPEGILRAEIDTIIETLFTNGGLPATPFKTKALMTASALVDGDYAMVTNDKDNNGLYVKTAGAWVKSEYDSIKKANDYTDVVAKTLAPLYSPKFTGTPTAPTATIGSEVSGQIANTSYAFFMHHKHLIKNITGGIEITEDETRHPILVFTGTASTVTLPRLGSSRQWTIRNATNGVVTLSASSNSIDLDKGISTVYCNATSVYKLISNGDTPVTPDTVPKPLTILDATLTPKSSADIIIAMGKDRTRGWSHTSTQLKETRDDGATWTTLHTFSGASIEAVRELGDGELLVVTTAGDTYRTVWRTVGYGTDNMTLEQCFKGHAPSVKFTQAWSIFVADNIVLINDYGPKAGFTWGSGEVPIAEGQNARYTRMSLDNGKTWKTIFDLNAWLTTNGYATTGCHLHGVAYDKWWDRLWITFGDNAYGIGGTVFSDDLGETWHWANQGNADKDNPALSPANSSHQVVGIRPMPTCILFGTDSAPNGIIKIDRVQGKKLTKYKMEVAFSINDDTSGSHLCQGIWQFSDEHPVFFAFSSEFKASPSCIVATWDGDNFVKVWEDSINNPSGMGLRSVVGPTIRGNLIAAHNDRRVVSKWSEIKGKAPIYKLTTP